MGKTLREKLSELPDDEQRAIRAETLRLAREYACLKDLRTALGHTQTGVAQTMGSKQASVSKLEGQKDMHLSTLVAYVAALGGSLNISVSFPGYDPVVLNGLGEVEENQPPH